MENPRQRIWGLRPMRSWRDFGLFIDDIADALEDLEKLGFECGIDWDLDGPLIVIRKAEDLMKLGASEIAV